MTISTDDVAALLGRDLTSGEDDRASRLIDIAESAIEAALPGFSFASGNETVDIGWHDPNVMWTPRYPVTAINSVTIGGGAVDLAGVRFDAKGKLELLPAGDPVINRTEPAAGWATVNVDYDYGLDPPPPVLAGIVATMVATILRRQGTNPNNVLSETIGSYQISYGAAAQDAQAAGMVVPDLPARWKRNVAVSVPLMRYR